jgi:hypothetical protein
LVFHDALWPALEVMLGFMGEFDLIETYFKRPPRHAVLGVGDDCALLSVKAGQQLAISSDMLVEGRHFLSTVNPQHLGHKALAVNLSDLAACGAQPKAFLLSLALPQVVPQWLSEFSKGMWALADAHHCDLIGGDTTRGPLNICITVLGEVPQAMALLRGGAKVGDDIYVSGHLGDARLALEVFRGTLSVPQAVFEAARLRMDKPTPRVGDAQIVGGDFACPNAKQARQENDGGLFTRSEMILKRPPTEPCPECAHGARCLGRKSGAKTQGNPVRRMANHEAGIRSHGVLKWSKEAYELSMAWPMLPSNLNSGDGVILPMRVTAVPEVALAAAMWVRWCSGAVKTNS